MIISSVDPSQFSLSPASMQGGSVLKQQHKTLSVSQGLGDMTHSVTAPAMLINPLPWQYPSAQLHHVYNWLHKSSCPLPRTREPVSAFTHLLTSSSYSHGETARKIPPRARALQNWLSYSTSSVYHCGATGSNRPGRPVAAISKHLLSLQSDVTAPSDPKHQISALTVLTLNTSVCNQPSPAISSIRRGFSD